MSKHNENLDDLSALHKELKDSIQADKLYWIRNDAKIRAVTSSQSYEEFRNIVQAAHLLPLTKEDKAKPKDGAQSAYGSWNRALNQ